MKRYPKAIQNPQSGDGGSMVGGPPRAVLHTTETPRTSSAYPYYHILFKDLGDVVHIEQLRPFERASLALRNLDGGVQTNRQGDVNINAVIIGYARDSDSLSDRMYEELNQFAIWLNSEYGVPLEFNAIQGAGDCFGYNSRCRMSSADWLLYSGWCGHQNVPENTHWDPGWVDWNRILKEGEEMITEEDVQRIAKQAALETARLKIARGSDPEQFRSWIQETADIKTLVLGLSADAERVSEAELDAAIDTLPDRIIERIVQRFSNG